MKQGQRTATVLHRDVVALPSDRPSGLRCIQLYMPDSDKYLDGLWGILALLAKWQTWERNDDRGGTEVAQLWRNALQRGLFTCDGKQIRTGEEFVVDMDICDFIRYHNGKLQLLCCGDWVDVPGATDGNGPPEPQPGPQPRPEPGGSACKTLTIDGTGQVIFPFPVSTGDVITLSDASGGWTDGTPVWFCPDGKSYVLGGCVPNCNHVGGDPLAGACHMAIIGLLNGVATFSIADSPYTVPAGVSDATLVFQANDGSLPDNHGAVTVKACVQNGATPPTVEWCSILDFTAADYGFTGYPEAWYGGPAANYVSGTGWKSVAAGGFSAVEIQSPAFSPATEITSVEVFYHVDTTMAGGIVTVNDNVTVYGSLDPSVGDHDTLITADAPGTTALLAFISKVSGAADTNTVISKVIVNGKGDNPFVFSNC